MTVLVDTGVLYADHDTDATRHGVASSALETVYEGELGTPYVSDHIYDEAVALTLTRADSFSPAKRIGERLRGAGSYPEVYEMLRVSAAVFTDAVDVFERYTDQRSSFTDATSVALCRRHEIDGVLSFDDGFDGVVERIPPESVSG